MIFFTFNFSLFAYKQLEYLQLFDEGLGIVLNIDLLYNDSFFFSWTSTKEDLALTRAYEGPIINNNVFGKK